MNVLDDLSVNFKERTPDPAGMIKVMDVAVWFVMVHPETSWIKTVWILFRRSPLKVSTVPVVPVRVAVVVLPVMGPNVILSEAIPVVSWSNPEDSTLYIFLELTSKVKSEVHITLVTPDVKVKLSKRIGRSFPKANWFGNPRFAWYPNCPGPL